MTAGKPVRTAGAQDEIVVVPFRLARRTKILMTVGVPVLVVGGLIVTLREPSATGIVVLTALIAALAVVALVVAAGHKARGGAPNQLVATRAGITTPTWSLTWDRLSSVRIGPMPASSRQALHLEPHSLGDVVWAVPTGWAGQVLRLNARSTAAARMAPIQIPQMIVDRPLEAIAADFERLAGRPLLVRR